MATERTLTSSQQEAEKALRRWAKENQFSDITCALANLLRAASIVDLDTYMMNIGYYPNEKGEYTRNFPSFAAYVQK